MITKSHHLSHCASKKIPLIPKSILTPMQMQKKNKTKKNAYIRSSQSTNNELPSTIRVDARHRSKMFTATKLTPMQNAKKNYRNHQTMNPSKNSPRCETPSKAFTAINTSRILRTVHVDAEHNGEKKKKQNQLQNLRILSGADTRMQN